MKILIYSIGKTRENFVLAGETLYLSRLKHYSEISLHDLPPYKGNEDRKHEILKREGEALLSKISSAGSLIALDPGGTLMSSEDFARLISQKLSGGASPLNFTIGGAFGLGDNLKERADLLLSLSPLTFPHELSRLILLEQLYRAFTILRREPYHK